MTTYTDPVFGDVEVPDQPQLDSAATEVDDPVFGKVQITPEAPVKQEFPAFEIEDPVFGKVAVTKSEDVGMATDIADYVRAATSGGVEYAGGVLRGSADVYDTLTNQTRKIVDKLAPEKVKELLRTEVPWWLSPAEILRRPGATVQEIGKTVDIPEERKTFGTEVAKGIGQLASQTAGYLLNPASGIVGLFASGAEQGARRAEAKGATQEEKDAAVTMSAAVTALSEKLGLDLLLNRVPPMVKNRILSRITDLGIAGGIEAAQEAIEGIGHNMVAAATYDPKAEIFEGVKEEASVAGVTGAIARAVLQAALPGKAKFESRPELTKGEQDAVTERDIPRDHRPEHIRTGALGETTQAGDSYRAAEGERVGSEDTRAQEETQGVQGQVTESLVKEAETAPPKAPTATSPEQASETITGIHFSNQEGLDTLEADRFGEGIKGAESYRQEAFPEIFEGNRVYFYIQDDVKTVPKKEPGLGSQVYKATLDKVYNAATDPMGLREAAKQEARQYAPVQNVMGPEGKLIPDPSPTAPYSKAAFTSIYERKIREAGFNGFYDPQSKVAVMFVDTPVQHLGSETEAKTILEKGPELPAPSEEVNRRLQDIGVEQERRTGDRRVEPDLREEVQDFLDTAKEAGIPEAERREMIEKSGITKLTKDMTTEERYAALRTSRKTGLPNDVAFLEDVIERKDKAQTGALDVDSLKWINDNMGHEAGDQLLSIVGRAIKEEISGTDIKGYHLSGDEFTLQGDSKLAIDQAVAKINEALKEAEITIETPSGDIITKKGFQLTHGVSPSPKRADFELAAEKIRKERAGLRAARGEEPPGVVRKPSKREQVSQREVAAQKIKKPVAGLPGSPKPVQPPAAGPVDLTKKFKFAKDETDGRIRDAQRGAAETKSIIQRLRDAKDFVRHGFTRHFRNIPNTPEWSRQIEYLRQLENAPEAAKENTVHYIKSVTKDMTKAEFDDFQIKVLLDDLLFEAKEGRALPFGYSTQELYADHANITARIDAQPKLKEAIRKRNTFIQDLGQRLVDKGVLSEDRLKNPNYFRHQVLEYARVRNMAQSATQKLRKPRPGYAKERTGSIKDINANYLEAEFEYVHRALVDLKTEETLKKIKAVDDITADVKAKAREENGAKLIASGKLNTAQELEYSEYVSTNNKSKLDAFLKEHLGKDYTSWEKFIPETHQLWQAEKGNIFFLSKTIGEHSIDTMVEMASAQGANLGFSQSELNEVLSQIKEALVVGGKKPRMVIRNELAATLDNMRTSATKGFFDQVLRKPTSAWKIWTLISPRHVFKYNINNLSSDLDALIAGNPSAMKKLKPAIGELWRIMHGAEPSARYKEALERNVFSSGLSIQEIPDINTLSQFEHLMDPKTGDLPRKNVVKAWRILKDYTQFRENWARYAAYLDYVEKLESGVPMSKVGYGASTEEMVDALDDVKDKAALLARELVGDYGGISAFGQEIRTKLIPFYSWMEVNLGRYSRLIHNAFQQGFWKGVETGTVLGTIKGTRLTVWLSVRIWITYALINLWNNLMFPDEEDKLSPEDKQRLHIILGTDADGNIVRLPIAGAFADYLSWVGWEEAGGIIADIERGKASIKDLLEAIAKAPINKVAGGITPVLKVPVELASGQSYWPDVFNPRVIPDKSRHVMRILAFENEFDWLTGRPSKGYLESWGKSFVTTTDPEELAYNSVRKKAFQFKEDVLGYSGISSISTPKSELIKLYKQALRLEDKEAAKRIKQEMRAFKITPKDIQESIKHAHPLGSIPLKDRSAFLKTLDKKERESLNKAIKYYNQTYR